MARRAREKAWAAFVAWCQVRRLTPLPAHPWTVAAYARWCESRYRYPALVLHVQAISRAHVLGCYAPPDRHPTVARTLRLIEARERTQGLRAALFPDRDYAPAAPFSKRKPKQSPKPSTDGAPRRRAMAGEPPLVSRRPHKAS